MISNDTQVKRRVSLGVGRISLMVGILPFRARHENLIRVDAKYIMAIIPKILKKAEPPSERFASITLANAPNTPMTTTPKKVIPEYIRAFSL